MEDEKRDNRVGLRIRSPTIKGAFENHLMRAVRFAAFNTANRPPLAPTHVRYSIPLLDLHLQCLSNNNNNLHPTIPDPNSSRADTYLDFSDFFPRQSCIKFNTPDVCQPRTITQNVIKRKKEKKQKKTK